MRKINGKLFLGLLLGMAVSTGAVFGVHYFQYQRIGHAVLWQARRAEEQGKIETCARYLQRYLEFNPKDDGEKAHLARVWLSESFPATPRARLQAIRLLDEVLNHEDRPDLRRLLVKTALDPALSQSKLARSHLEKLLPEKQAQERVEEGKAEHKQRIDKEMGELEGFWGQLLEAEGHPEKAPPFYRAAIRHAPEEQSAYVHLAYLLRRQKEPDADQRRRNEQEADQVLDDLVAANDSSYNPYLSRWRYRRDFDLFEVSFAQPTPGKIALAEASEDVAKALQRGPESVEVLLAAADLERLLGNAAAVDPKKTPQEQEQLLQKHRDEAYKLLRHGLSLQKDASSRPASDLLRFQLLWHKANLLLDDVKRLDDKKEADSKTSKQIQTWLAEIHQTIDDLRKTRGEPATADYLQGRVLIHERRWADAAARFEHVRARLATQPELVAQANLYLAQCYEQLEEPSQMYDAYKRVADLDAASVPALLGMASAEWSLGRLDSARDKYEQVKARYKMTARGWLDFARLEMQRQMQSNPPDWKEVEDALASARELNPKSVETTLLKADLFAARKQMKEAEALLTKARSEQPDQVDLWVACVDLARRIQRPDQGFALLDEAEKKLNAPVPLRLARARLLSETQGKKAKDTINALTLGSNQFSEEDQARLLNGLADAQFRAENVEDARRLWTALAELPHHKSDLRLRLLLFDLALRQGDEAGMDQALSNIRAIERNEGAYHRYGQALRLIWQVKNEKADHTQALDDARLQLDRVLTLRPTWPPVYLARAEIAELSGNPEQAINDLKEAVKNGDSNPTVVRRLSELLAQRGRFQEAEQELNRLKEALLVDSELGRMAANLAVQQQDLSRALRLASQAVKADTKDPKELVWLGRLLAAAEKPTEAEQKLRQAVQLGPQEPSTWVGLVQFLVGRRRVSEALPIIKDAEAKLPRDKAPLAVAQCYEVLGRKDQALPYYQAALKAHPEDPIIIRTVATFHLNAGRLQEAEPLLRKLVSREVKATPADVLWAQRSLATVLASGTDYQCFQDALKLVGLALDENGQLRRETARDDSTESQRAKARVLATQTQRQFRLRAIELLENLARSQALTPDDQFILALLYDAEGSWAKSREQLRSLVLTQTQTPQYLAQYAQGLIRQRQDSDLAEAERWTNRLAELEKQRDLPPNSYASVELRAQLLEAREEGDKAVSLLRAHVQRPGAKPEEILLVLASLARQKRYGDAYTLCEQGWDKKECSREAMGGVSVGLLRAMKPTDAQVLRVENRLKEAIRNNPNSTVLLMHLADLFDMRGRYAEAEAQYRLVLEKEKGNIVALNNLAWLLALRSGNGDEAMTLINTAVKGLGHRPDLLDTRGLVHLALGQTDKALADFKEATSDTPTPTRLFHLARAHNLAKDRDNAVKVLRLAKERGLSPSALHPVEQESCRQLLAELKLE
jgi:Tfp pilus assembly protein PilF